MAGLKGEFNVVELVIAVSALLISMYVFLSFEHLKTSSWHIIKTTLYYLDLFESLSHAKILDSYVFGERSNLPTVLLGLSINPNRIRIACNCTNETQELIISLFESEINNKKINIDFCLTTIESFNYCIASSDVLVIDILPNDQYINILKKVLDNDIGLLLYADASAFTNNNVLTNIFGISRVATVYSNRNISFSSTLSTYREEIFKNFYEIYKNFYGINLYLQAFTTFILPNCVFNVRGEIKIFNKSYSYSFVVCNSTNVVIDFNRNGNFEGHEYRTVGNRLSFSGFPINVTLKKIARTGIWIKFDKHNLILSDITKNVRINVVDGDRSRVVLNSTDGLPALVTNTTYSRVAWLQNFNHDVSDDKKVVLLSTLIWLSEREIQIPSIFSYIYFDLKDSYFVYKIEVPP
ncbi:MAG: hypothetical protein RMJ17_00480 [Candidatus Aenigmarchaeota archaeon]|nr:hypothetical protein [Candidatus Aenigmarchaeota archaeon]MDW8149064.1 hypothetical protein [Candidatus Aenigmarchaeota archaeon]